VVTQCRISRAGVHYNQLWLLSRLWGHEAETTDTDACGSDCTSALHLPVLSKLYMLSHRIHIPPFLAPQNVPEIDRWLHCKNGQVIGTLYSITSNGKQSLYEWTNCEWRSLFFFKYLLYTTSCIPTLVSVLPSVTKWGKISGFQNIRTKELAN